MRRFLLLLPLLLVALPAEANLRRISIRSSAGGFDYSTAPSYYAHWNCSDATKVTKDGSNFISQVADQAGTRHLAQATASQQMLWESAGLGGRGSCKGDGTDDVLISSTMSLTGNIAASIYLVLQPTAIREQGIWGWGTCCGVAYAAMGMWMNDTPTRWSMEHNSGQPWRTNIAATLNPTLLAIRKTPGPINTSYSIRVNSVDATSVSVSTATPNITSQGFSMGRWSDYTGGDSYFSGRWGQVIIYGEVHTLSQTQAIEAALKTYYGIP